MSCGCLSYTCAALPVVPQADQQLQHSGALQLQGHLSEGNQYQL